MICDIPKKTPRGLADVDMRFISHITGEGTDGDGGRSVPETPHPSESETSFKGSQRKETRVLPTTLNYITSV